MSAEKNKWAFHGAIRQHFESDGALNHPGEVPNSKQSSTIEHDARGGMIMSVLPPHFFVWLLYMHMSGNAMPIAGFKTEAMCMQIRADMTAKASSAVKYRCDKFAIEK